MANKFLFISSLFCTFIHGLALIWFNNNNLLLTITIICGLLTSLLNHGLTYKILIFIDRIMMIFGFISNLYSIYFINSFINQYLCLFLLHLSAILYLFAKLFTKKNILHLAAHLFLLITNIILIYEFSNTSVIY